MLKNVRGTICGVVVVLMATAAILAQSTTQVLSDAEITSSVKTKLLADTTVGGLKIDVDTKDGVVTLTGPVSTSAERAQAIRLATNTGGVKKVVNKLVVDPNHKSTTDKTKDAAGKAAEATKDGVEKAGEVTKDAAIKTKDVVADATITSEVKTKLLGDTKVAGLKINVDTKDNVVTLTGVVTSHEEKNEALRLARTTMGVKRVVDKLTVK